MVVSNLPTNGTEVKSGKGKAKPILVTSEALAALDQNEKNVQMQASVHPALHAAFIKYLAGDATNVSSDDAGVGILKRTAYSQAIRKALAGYVGYTGELVKEGRGGNVMGIVTAFNTTVQSMFSAMRNMAAISQMPDEQVKEFAFAQAKAAVASHPQLGHGVEVSDEVLEKLWSGGEVELDIDEDDDDEDEDDK